MGMVAKPRLRTASETDSLYLKAVPFLAWAVGSALVFACLTFLVAYLIQNSQPGAKELNKEFQGLLPGMAYGYFFGFVGAAVRLAVDYDRKAVRTGAAEQAYFSDKAKVARLFIGSIFGMLAVLLLSTGILQSVLLGFDPEVVTIGPDEPVPLKAILLFGFLAGLFAGETFGSLQKRFNEDQGGPSEG